MRNALPAGRVLTILFLTSLGIASVVHAADQKADASLGKLKFVIVVSRHGVRSPTGSLDQLNQYSSQPWPKWTVPPGDLTPHGATLMTIFGAYYRSYLAQQGLVAPRGCADAAQISFYSDSDKRTVETGTALAAGMFPNCPKEQRPAQHALPEGDADPLFHSLAAGVGKPDHERAVASIAGRIGNNPAGVTEAYQPQLDQLQYILLGCPPSLSPCPSPGHMAARLMLEIPPSLDVGKGDHLAELKGPLNTASTLTENLLLEYTEGLPMDQVGWGRVDLVTLKQLIDLHTAASDLTRRTSYLATVQASNLLAHILHTLQQAETGKETPGALGRREDRAVILVGHDTNLANLAGMLNLNWLVDGRRDDLPPGGALVFELWRAPQASKDQVRVYYTAQTLQQMHDIVPLTVDKPPAKADIFIPQCSTGGRGFPCDWKAFAQAVDRAIDYGFVR